MENFEEIIKSTIPVLIDFYATWCGPCKMMHPILDELHKNIGEKARIIKIDVDNNKRLAAAWKIKSVPTLMIFKGGELKWRDSGVHSATDLQAEIEKYI